jgi:hypothetical protein
MSKYDLTRFNPWYFQRVKDFASLCDANGRILFFNFYFQHALQEIRAHYVDFPWRPVNCIQETGMPEETPAGATFYDLSNPVRRDLHLRYIRHCLDVLKGKSNVVFGLDPEFTGPQSFVEFWLDAVRAWEDENGQKVFIALEVPKAEMDSLLVDPRRGRMITAVGFQGWFYRPDGSLYAALGGINKAVREQSPDVLTDRDMKALRDRMTDPRYRGNVISSPEGQRMLAEIRDGSPAMRYRAWREYRDQYPELVLLGQSDGFPELSAAVERSVPAEVRGQMRPADLVRDPRPSSWVVAAVGRGYIVYSIAGGPVELDLSGDRGTFQVRWINSLPGAIEGPAQLLYGEELTTLSPPAACLGHPWAAWLAPRQ